MKAQRIKSQITPVMRRINKEQSKVFTVGYNEKFTHTLRFDKHGKGYYTPIRKNVEP